MHKVAEILKKSYSTRSPTISGTLSNDETPIGPGKPGCPFCNGLGYVIPNVGPEHPGFGRAIACSCRAAEQEVNQRDSLLSMSQLIGALLEHTFENFLPEGTGLPATQRRNLKMAFDRVYEFAKNPQGWLLIKGGYGCGKTHLAAAVANYRLAEGHQVLFINTPDLLDHLRATYHPDSLVSYDDRFEQVRKAPLLILDDFGTQSSSEWAEEKLYQIFNYRYNTRLPTIITTNIMEEDSVERRISSRMGDLDLSKKVHIIAPDFRQGGGQEHSELSSLSLHREQTFDTFDLRTRELPHAQSENLRRAFETAREFAAAPTNWLILNGIAFGCGKTHLAAAIANYVTNTGEPVLFVVVPDLLDHLRASFNPRSEIRLDKRFEEVKTIPLLVLDDLGTESATAWAREKLYQLFNYRYNARLPTVITTATPVDELDPRLATRMLDVTRCTFFVLEVPSYRGGVKARQQRGGRPK